jgi:type VI secretion system protein ImpH
VASPLREENPVVTLQEPTNLQEAKDLLFSDPNSFDFFQAVRLLELLAPDRSPVGDFAHPRHEVVRFSVNASLAFPASAIQRLKPGEPERPAAMDVNFMGLVGPLGLLPNYYTELVAERTRVHDTALASFLNIFHHRIISLFYRAWERTHFNIGYEREGSDAMTSRLLDFVGLGLPALQSRQVIRDESILYYSGLFGLSSRSALALESILSDYFDVPVEIEQFVGVWRSLVEADQCCFDLGPGECRQVGFGAVVGDEIWDRQSRAQIRIGPLDAKRYRDFLPDGTCFKPLQALARFYSGYDVEYEVQLILKQEQVPACELGDELGNTQLGWFTWMKSKPSFDRNPCDTVLLFAENSYDS